MVTFLKWKWREGGSKKRKREKKLFWNDTFTRREIWINAQNQISFSSLSFIPDKRMIFDNLNSEGMPFVIFKNFLNTHNRLKRYRQKSFFILIQKEKKDSVPLFIVINRSDSTFFIVLSSRWTFWPLIRLKKDRMKREFHWMEWMSITLCLSSIPYFLAVFCRRERV